MRKLLLTTALCALSFAARANPIPVVNGDFSQLPTTNSQFAGFTVGPGLGYLFFSCGANCAFADDTAIGWNSTGTFDTAHGIVSGQWLTGVDHGVHNAFLTSPSNGEPIVFRDINDVTSQIVTATALPGVTYTLDVEMGFDIGHKDLGQIQLWVGGHEVFAGPASNDPLQKSGGWENFEVSYTAGAGDIGDPIKIALSSLTGDATPTAWFANVRLSDSITGVAALGTPEPSTWAMLLSGFAFMGVLGLRRARLKS